MVNQFSIPYLSSLSSNIYYFLILQVLEPPSTTSYKTEAGHFIKTFLISTKPNQANWQISKETGHQMVQSFKGKPFVIIPEELSSSRQKGHIFADTKEQLLEEYKKHTHVIIESISSPFFYGDGTDDYFYMANIKLNDSLAASALMEHGNTWNTFAVSPHIWGDPAKEWEGISLSLVPQGAYGKDAVVTKYCKGETKACSKSLESDSLAASMITSLLSQNENTPILSTQVVEVKEGTNQPIKQEEVKQDNSKIEELESLKKQLEEAQNAAKEKDDQVSKLVNKDKTNTLNKLFVEVKDETVKESLIKDFIKEDTDLLERYTSAFVKHVVPSLIEKANVVKEEQPKSKAGSLPKEPQVEESKAASIVPNSENQVKKFDRLMRGFI